MAETGRKTEPVFLTSKTDAEIISFGEKFRKYIECVRYLFTDMIIRNNTVDGN